MIVFGSAGCIFRRLQAESFTRKSMLIPHILLNNGGCVTCATAGPILDECSTSSASIGLSIPRQSVKSILNTKAAGDVVHVQGWVRALRKQKQNTFLDVNDGSSFHRLPVVCPTDKLPRELSMHSSVKIVGELLASPKNPGLLELHPLEIVKTIGLCDQKQYPLGGKIVYEDDYVRQFFHLRSKTNKFSSYFRLRSAATKAVNDFFFANDFTQIHTPILTSHDCEGGGEVFLVKPASENFMTQKVVSATPISPKEILDVQSHDHHDLPTDGKKYKHAHKCEVCGAIFSHAHTKKPPDESRKYDNHYCENHKHLRKDMPAKNIEEAFFDSKVYLTVSGQLHLEAMTSGLERVWTFSPAFRAENCNSSRHLSEFYMVEAEIGFAEKLEQILDPMEKLTKYVIEQVMYGNTFEWEFGTGYSEKNCELHELLDTILKHPFTVIPYAEAVSLMQTKANIRVSPAEGINREQELLLVEKLNNNIPVFLVDWPAELKPFYVKHVPEEPSKCSAVDLLMPRVGELCGGSLREPELEKLRERITATDPTGDMEKSLSWYFDLRRFGGIPTGGFGLGFDRLLQLMLGVQNIREVVPFPRWPHSCRM